MKEKNCSKKLETVFLLTTHTTGLSKETQINNVLKGVNMIFSYVAMIAGLLSVWIEQFSTIAIVSAILFLADTITEHARDLARKMKL